MSPRNSVTSLKQYCITYLSTTLIRALSDDQLDHSAPLTAHFADATFLVLQQLLAAILNSHNLDAATRFASLRLLLREDVKHLEVGSFPYSYYVPILRTIAEQGSGLQHLNLKGVWARDQPKLLAHAVSHLPKLRSLIVPHMVDDLVLEAIVNCGCLSTLDISGECSLTSVGLGLLHQANELTVLELGSFGKREVWLEDGTDWAQLVGQVLANLPNLLSLRVYSFTGAAILWLSKNQPNHKTKLKYLHDTGTTREVVKALVELCPDLENIHVDTPDSSVLAHFEHFTKLNTLKLTRYKFDELIKVLPKLGARIYHLTLNSCKANALDLSLVCELLPNLQTLHCYKLRLAFRRPDAVLRWLQDVELLYCEVSDAAVRLLLVNGPLLRRVIIGCAIRMTDGDVVRLCGECELCTLEELWVSCATGLTCASVELLMGHCPNLRVLGQLTGWDVHQEEIDYLRLVNLYTNTNLRLLPSQ